MEYKIEKPAEIENNENMEVCSICNGSCCKNCGCTLHPYDVFKNGPATYERLKALIDTGIYSIDSSWGDPRDLITWGVSESFRWDHEKHKIPKSIKLDKDEGLDPDDMLDETLFIRIRNISSPIVDFTYGGRCILLGENGCNIDFDHRPYGGKVLIPYKDESKKDCVGCKLPDFIGDAYKKWFAMQWIPYQDILRKLYNEIWPLEQNLK